jgi:alpha-glucosidase (family GH31 glycosyl hydrolase)
MEPWIWEDDVNTAVVRDLVNGCKEHDLPIGAVLLDSLWSTAYNNFIFDQARATPTRAA